MREHYANRHRDAYFGGVQTRPAAALKALDADAHPWGVRGNIAPNPREGVVVAGVLDLDDLEAEITAIFHAAEEALEAVAALQSDE